MTDVKGLLTCGDVERGEAIVFCECGLVRGVNRPHGYVKPVVSRTAETVPSPPESEAT